MVIRQYRSLQRSLAVLWLSLAFFAAPALAQVEPAAGHRLQASHSAVSLLSERTSLAPGQTFWLAVHFEPAEGWHTYWKNPGDSGITPILNWQAAGVNFAEPLYGVPHALPTGPLTNYGYEGPSTLLVQATAPARIPTDGLPVSLSLEWLVCKVECIPQGGDLALVVPAGEGAMNAAAADIFTAARAALPEPSYWDAELAVTDTASQLKIFMSAQEASAFSDAYFFPSSEGVLTYASPQNMSVTPAGLLITAERYDGDLAPENGQGIAYLTQADGGHLAVSINAALMTALAGNVPPASDAAAAPAASAQSAPLPLVPALPLWQAALFALLGGVLLNLMPCVFPVLSLKAFAFASASGNSVQENRREGWAYTAGILASFAVVVAALLAVRAGGHLAGWGFQLQEPGFVAVMILVMLLVGLALSGMFNLTLGFEAAGQGLTTQGGLRGAFFTGVLATLVATPCTGPLMGPAIGYALSQPPVVTVMIFLTLGFGLALPFLILSYSPAAARLLPRPGPWMERFKQFLAFPMYLTAAWLASVYITLTDSQAFLGLMAALIAVVFAIWLWQGSHRLPMRAASGGVAALALWVLAQPYDAPPRAANPGAAEAGGEVVFSREGLDDLVASGGPVFAYFTADWCITCKANERVALHRDETEALFRERNVTIVKGDWTNRNDEIAELLARYGRAGVPLYLYFPGGGGDAVVLPQVLSVGIIKSYIEGST